MTASELLHTLRASTSVEEAIKIRRHFPHDDPVLGVRMKAVFDTAKAFSGMPLAEVHALFDRPEYEARLAAACVLDFKARKHIADEERQALCEVYLGRHDRINDWGMIDRAAPHVVGRYLMDLPHDPLFTLARSSDVYERRTAMTAPLYWARYGKPAHLEDLFQLAKQLLHDSDQLVSKPVGIALKHAGTVDEAALTRFLDEHATEMHRPTLRYAVEKHPRRERYL